MSDPESEYRRLTSGDPGVLDDAVETLRGSARRVERTADDIDDAAGGAGWASGAARAFIARVASLSQGARSTGSMITQARGALETAASAYRTCEHEADHYIGLWRDRPTFALPGIDQLFARLVTSRLLAVGAAYNSQLRGVVAVLEGGDVDLDELDAETRAWVERGLERNRDWMDTNDSLLGPVIPNTAATGDDRGWIPQGLGYDPAHRSFVQAYYSKDGTSSLALVDEVTGSETTEVQLGHHVAYDEGTGSLLDSPAPAHAGGVAVDGDHVYVTDNGTVHTYSLRDIRDAAPGDTVPPVTAPAEVPVGGSYAAFHDGTLYLGDHHNSELQAYTEDGSGGWAPSGEPIPTPPYAQGVTVRDDEFVFSTSSGRGDSDEPGALVSQSAHDPSSRSEPYVLPHMSQGVVETDGGLVTSYESGAEEFDDPRPELGGLLPGDPRDLWANPRMTVTPLSDLGLSVDVEVDPASLDRTAGDLDAPASALSRESTTVRAVDVTASALGEVPAAGAFSHAIGRAVQAAADSLRTGSRATRRTGDAVAQTARDYRHTDDGVAGAMRRGTPG